MEAAWLQRYIRHYGEMVTAAVERGEAVPDPHLLRGFMDVWRLAGVEPPTLTSTAPLVYLLPPLIKQTEVERHLGVSPKTLRNHKSKGTGPRVCWSMPYGTVYPTVFLLEWMERHQLGADFLQRRAKNLRRDGRTSQ